MGDIKEFMAEERKVNRWFVLAVAIAGAFCGALLTAAFMLLGFV